jgi:O-antigen/teichoic acid export membrane protein
MPEAALSGPPRLTAGGEFKSSLVLRVVAAGGGLAATLLTTVVAVRGLVDADAAVFLAVLAGLMLGPMFGKLGLGQNVIRTVGAQDEPTRRRTVTAHLRAALLLSALSSPVIAFVSTIGLLGRSGQAAAIVLTAVILVAETVRLLLSDVFAAVGDVRGSVATTHHVRTVVVLPALAVLVLAVPNPTLTEMLSVYCVIAVALMVVALWHGRRLLSFSWRAGAGGLAATMITGLALFALDGAFFVVGRGDVWLSSALFDPFDAARYGTVSMLAFQVTVLQGLASLAITPAAARLWATGAHDRVRRLLSATATLATTATLAVVAALAAVGGPLLGLAYGPDFVSGLPLLLILAAGGVGQAAFGFSVPYLLVSRMIKRAVVSCGLALVVAVPLCVVGAAVFGPWGLAAASAMSAILLPVAQTVAAGGVPLPSWNVAEAVRVLRRSGEVPAS